MRCLPATADQGADQFWQQCGNPGASEEFPPAYSVLDKVRRFQPTAAQTHAGRLKPTRANLDATAKPQRAIQLVSAEEIRAPSTEAKSDSAPLRLPPELPGAETPPLVVPKMEGKSAEERRRLLNSLYHDLAPLPDLKEALPPMDGESMGIEEFHELARSSHPRVRSAAAEVEAARGRMIQAGLPPNPNMGYEADTVRTLFTNGYQGGYVQQTIITAHKLGLAAEAAAYDHANALLELRKTWIEVTSEIRRQYFRLLTARQKVVLAKALMELSSRAYQAQIKLVEAGEAASYEPLQLKVLTFQARAAVIQAQQESVAAWRSLAAAAANPDLAPVAVQGRIDCPVPGITFDDASARMVESHTDLQVARNLAARNQVFVDLADRKPIPDINVGVVVQHDDTFQPGTTTYNLLVGGAIPIFDRNQGNRIAARADNSKACLSLSDTRNRLLGELASAFGTYEANRQLAGAFRTEALRDQVRAYRGIYQRYRSDPEGIDFNDVIVAQQTLATTLNQYLGILDAQWQAVVDLGELLQVEDIFQLGPEVEVAELPSPADLTP